MNASTFAGLLAWTAVSPQTLAVVLYLLGGPRGLRAGWVFVAALFAASIGAGVLVAVGMGDLGIHIGNIGGGHRFPVAYIVVGAVLIAFAFYVLWRHVHARTRRHRHERKRDEHRLDRMLASPWLAIGVGLAFGMPGVPYALALAETEGNGWLASLGVILAFSIASEAAGWIPAVWCTLQGDRALRRLAAIRASVGRHHVAIIVAVLLVVGIYMVIFGIVTS